MSPSFKPGDLVLSKQEILNQFDVAIARLQKSPGNFRFTKELQIVKFMVGRTSAEKFPYYWMEIKKIFDAVTTLNETRREAAEHPKMAPLAKFAELELQRTIITVPVPKPQLNTELDFIKQAQRVREKILG